MTRIGGPDEKVVRRVDQLGQLAPHRGHAIDERPWLVDVLEADDQGQTTTLASVNVPRRLVSSQRRAREHGLR